jgi:Na+/proline symporter
MSTADAFLNIGAAAIVHDIPRAFRGRSLVRELYWARERAGR